LVPFREDRLDCLGLSDFSLLGDSADVPDDERRLDDFGNSGKSWVGELCDPTGELGAPAGEFGACEPFRFEPAVQFQSTTIKMMTSEIYYSFLLKSVRNTYMLIKNKIKIW